MNDDIEYKQELKSLELETLDKIELLAEKYDIKQDGTLKTFVMHLYSACKRAGIIKEGE